MKRISPVLNNRWSCRAYSGKAVEPGQIQALLEAARWAPSSYNEQPWRWVVVARQEAERFEKALGCLGGNREWAAGAGLILFNLAVPTFARNGKANIHAWHDVGMAVMSMATQAVELGLQCREMAGIDRDLVRQGFKVPEHLEIVSGFAIGQPAGPMPAERKRRPFEESVLGPLYGSERRHPENSDGEGEFLARRKDDGVGGEAG